MANNVDKSVYTAPQGLESLDDNEPDIQIEVEDPESMAITAGGMTIVLQPEPEGPDDFDANLAEFMDEGDLAELSGDLLGDYDADEASRKEWLDTYVDGNEV